LSSDFDRKRARPTSMDVSKADTVVVTPPSPQKAAAASLDKRLLHAVQSVLADAGSTAQQSQKMSRLDQAFKALLQATGPVHQQPPAFQPVAAPAPQIQQPVYQHGSYGLPQSVPGVQSVHPLGYHPIAPTPVPLPAIAYQRSVIQQPPQPAVQQPHQHTANAQPHAPQATPFQVLKNVRDCLDILGAFAQEYANEHAEELERSQ